MDKNNVKKRPAKKVRAASAEPACSTHKNCFANKHGKCICLSDNDFGKKECPFYKTEREVRNG